MVYCLEKNNRTYVGATLNFERRLRQHNGEITGGARYTTFSGPGWRPVFHVVGFPNQRAALQFEWALHRIRGVGNNSVERRFNALNTLMRKTRVTSTADLLSSWNLRIIRLPSF